MIRHSDFVEVTPGFKAAINLSTDWDDATKIASYIPTRFSLRMLHEIGGALSPTSSARVFNISGPYGVGKSHLGLTIAAYLRHPFDAGWLDEFFKKTSVLDSEITTQIVRDRQELGAPMLVVRLYGSPAPTRDALFQALDDALMREGLSDIRPETAFSAAIARIDEVESVYPESVPAMIEAFRSVGYPSVDEMRQALRAYKDEALQSFVRVHPQFSSGAQFVHHHGQKPGDVYRQISLQLQRQTGSRQRSGIAILWDEFTLHAEKVLADPTGTQYMDVQEFVEACLGSGAARLLFISLSHRSIAQVVSGLGGLDEKQREALNKVAGRFAERFIKQEPGEQYHLMGRVLIQKSVQARQDLFRTFSTYFAAIEARTQDLRLFPTLVASDVKRLIFGELYPLHPATAALLPLLSARIAQNDRTLFNFLSDTGPNTLTEFLTESAVVDGRPNLLTVDRLFPYFIVAIAASRQDDIRALYARYRRIRPLSESQQRLVNTLLLLQVAGSSVLIPTAANLGFALGCTSAADFANLKAELETLRKLKVLREGAGGVYEIRRLDQEIDFEETLEQAEQDIPADIPVLKLLMNWTSSACVGVDIRATRHNQRFKTDRGYDSKLVLPDELRLDPYKEAGKPRDTVDAVAYWVAAMTERDLQLARQYAEEFTNNRILIVLPKEPISLQVDLRRYQALKKIEKMPPFGPSGLQRDEWEEEFTELESRILNRLMECFSQGVAYLAGKPCSFSSPNELEDVASTGMDRAFPKTLIVPHERLVCSQGSDTQRQHRQPLLDVLLDKSRDLGQFLEHGPAPSRLIARAVLETNGWLRREGEAWVVACPDPQSFAVGAEVWQLIERFVRNKKPTPFTVLIDTLTEPPYGIRRRVLPVLIAAVVRTVLDSVEFLERGKAKTIEPSAALMERIAKEPAKVMVRYVPLTDQQYMLLEAVLDGLAVPVPLASNPVAQVTGALRRRCARTKGLARVTSQLPEHVLAYRDQFFMSFAADLSDDQARALLFEVLPAICGIADLRYANRSEIRNKVIPLIREATNSMAEVSQRLLLPVVAGMVNSESVIESIKGAIQDILSMAVPDKVNQLQPKQQQILGALQKVDLDNLETSVLELAKVLLPEVSGLNDDVLRNVEAAGRIAIEILKEQLSKPAPEPLLDTTATNNDSSSTSVPAEIEDNETSQEILRSYQWGQGLGIQAQLDSVPETTVPPVLAPLTTTLEIQWDGQVRTLVVTRNYPSSVKMAIKAVRAAINRPGLCDGDKVETLATVLLELLSKGY